MFIDSHCHLDFPALRDDLDTVLASMRDNGVAGALCVAVTLEDAPRVRQLAEEHDHLWASVGVHPDYEGVREPDVEMLCEAAKHPRIVAIGETGLDYFRVQGDPHWQRERFRVHVRAACASGLPLIVHTRAAREDTLRILREEGASQCGGVLHCFTENWEVASAALDLGMYISFSGIVTFKNAADLREIAARVPADRILVETDSPYLAPVPHRGKRNQPAWVRDVAAGVAEVRGLELGELAEITTANFFELFKKARPNRPDSDSNITTS
ncbi:MAG: TatD family hydrolase [Burkholderiaceae bacterium]